MTLSPFFLPKKAIQKYPKTPWIIALTIKVTSRNFFSHAFYFFEIVQKQPLIRVRNNDFGSPEQMRPKKT